MSKAENFHTIDRLKIKCRNRIPKIAFEYLESGTDKETIIQKNESQFDDIYFIPRFCGGNDNSSTEIKFLGMEYSAPIGIAPIGLTGLIWPKAENYLVNTAEINQIPFCLSTVATCEPEGLDPNKTVDKKNKWFQLYPPKDLKVSESLLRRAKKNNFSHLVVTVDIPAPSRRERSRHAGLNMPLKFSPSLIMDAILHPKWTLNTIKNGLPRLKTVEKYSENNDLKFTSEFVGNRLGGIINWDYIRWLKSNWDGPLILKGILHEDEALKAKELGCDAIYVSNHGGRQFDGGTSPLKQLMKIRRVVGNNYPLIYDSGIRSGLDVMKAIYLGADMVFVGRPFMYGVGAFQGEGAGQVFNILKDQLRNNMLQMGLQSVHQIKYIPNNQVEVNFN